MLSLGASVSPGSHVAPAPAPTESVSPRSQRVYNPSSVESAADLSGTEAKTKHSAAKMCLVAIGFPHALHDEAGQELTKWPLGRAITHTCPWKNTLEPRFGFGLRGRLILVLGVAFAIAFGLLSLAARELDRRRQVAEMTETASRVGQVIAAELGPVPSDYVFDRVIVPLLAASAINGAALRRPQGPELKRGKTEGEATVIMSLGGSAELQLWLPDMDPGTRFSNPLLLYVGVTGAAILLLVYTFLTTLIVRPVEVLRGASERLARGNLYTSVAVHGATEIAQLSAAFNQMADQLRADRVALQQRFEELQSTTTELRDAQDHVIRSGKLAAVGQLSAGVAHEIGNPLAAIQGLLELLQSEDLSKEEAAEFIDRVQRETERIHGTIRNLLDFSRHDQEGAQEDETNLKELVADTIRLVTPQKRFERVRVVTRIAPEVTGVHGSSDRLGQLFVNLLLNAADAMEGTGTVTIDARLSKDGSMVVVQVSDNGPGIDSQVIDRIFEPFVTTKPAGKGTGLGLSVCQTLVDRLGGTIAVRNRADGGACFEVCLPVS